MQATDFDCILLSKLEHQESEALYYNHLNLTYLGDNKLWFQFWSFLKYIAYYIGVPYGSVLRLCFLILITDVFNNFVDCDNCIDFVSRE